MDANSRSAPGLPNGSKIVPVNICQHSSVYVFVAMRYNAKLPDKQRAHVFFLAFARAVLFLYLPLLSSCTGITNPLVISNVVCLIDPSCDLEESTSSANQTRSQKARPATSSLQPREQAEEEQPESPLIMLTLCPGGNLNDHTINNDFDILVFPQNETQSRRVIASLINSSYSLAENNRTNTFYFAAESNASTLQENAFRSNDSWEDFVSRDGDFFIWPNETLCSDAKTDLSVSLLQTNGTSLNSIRLDCDSASRLSEEEANQADSAIAAPFQFIYCSSPQQ